jgi:hypothetical protein
LWIPRIVSILLALSAAASAQFTQAPGSPFGVGGSPISVAVGDFNADGQPDLAIANSADNTVTVLLGIGTGGFTAAPGSPFPIGARPSSLAVGDFNGDGNLDLAITTELATVTVLLGNGAGGFTAASGSPFPAGEQPSSVAVADFNGDGKLDLAIADSESNAVTVLLGNGAGGFTAASGSPFPVGALPSTVAVGDFNGDGKPDLATANQLDNTVTVLLGNGAGGFTAASGSPFPVGSSPFFVAVGDFNGDGKPDLAITNHADNNVTVLLGNGTGGFAPAPGSPFPVGSEPLSVAVGDFNGDGKPDLATANYSDGSVTVLLGNGAGGFTAAPYSPLPAGNGPQSVAVGDFNGDGKPDLAISNVESDNVTVLLNITPGAKLLWQNDTTAQVTVHYYGGPQGNIDLGWNWVNMAGAPGWKLVGGGDFDGDGVPDLVWMNTTTQQVTVNYYGGPEGTIYQGWSWLNEAGAPGWTVVAVADMDGNGVPDLIWQNNTTNQVAVNYYGGLGGAVYQGWNWLNSAGEPSGWQVVGAADFDGNGVPDLIWEYQPTRQVTVNYYGGAGGAVYQGWNYLNSTGVPGWTVVGANDFNGDGVPDLVWQNDVTAQVTVNYYGGPGGSTYTGWNWLEASGFPGWTAVVPVPR